MTVATDKKPAKDRNPHSTDRTQWHVVWIAFGAGVIAASHIGKLPPALPDIRVDLDASLIMAGWIASIISAIGFSLGLVAGSFADKLGQRRVLVFGLLALTAGSVLGAFAQTDIMMLVARFIEGIGFTASTITGGAIIARATRSKDRRWALGIWAAYMPVGFAAMLMVSALIIEAFDWRVLWGVSALLSLLWAGAVLKVTRTWQASQTTAVSAETVLNNVKKSLSHPGGILVGICFAMYSAQHISMMNWLPTYMTEVYGSNTIIAATIPAIVLGFNAGGNYLAAWAMGRSIPIWLLLLIGALGMGLTEIGIFSPSLNDTARLLMAFAFGVFGGLIPAAGLAAAPVYAPSPVQIGTMNGLMVMGTNTGQLFGPPAWAAARESAGNWNGIIWLVLVLAAIGTIAALASRPYERHRHA